MIDRNPTSPPELPAPQKPRGFAAQFCWTIFFALVLAVGLFVIRHGRLPGLDSSVFAAAGPQSVAPGSAGAPAPSSGNYPGAPYAPPAALPNPVLPKNPAFNPSVASNSTTGWTQQVCMNLIFEAPVTVAPRGAPRHFPASMMQHVEFMNWWEGKISNRLDIAIGDFRIDGAHTLSFADGVRGAETSMRNRGVTVDDAGFNPAPIYISGCIARRISGTRVSAEGTTREDMLVIQRRRECIVIGVEYVEELKDDAMRILNSVQVRGGANG